MLSLKGPGGSLAGPSLPADQRSIGPSQRRALAKQRRQGRSTPRPQRRQEAVSSSSRRYGGGQLLMRRDRVLVVDADPQLQRLLRARLQAGHYEVRIIE